MLFDLADALRLRHPYQPDSAQHQAAARLYELSLETSRRRGDREMAANALLTLVTLDIGRGADTAALARCGSASTQFVGVKSMFGRTDAYATWQMMELAWRHKQTALTRSLARKIIINYPAEVGNERVITRVGWGGTPTYGTQSVWFDIRAAERLLEAVAGDESQVAATAEFLTKSTSVAVRFRGYEKLVALSQKRSDAAAARSYARTALSLPHYWQLEITPPSGCTNPGGQNKHDFKDEFMTRLDGLMPFDDLMQLYDGTYDAKDTMVSRDAANWFIRQIEQGRAPARAGILDRIGPPNSPAEFKRALLASITTAPQLKTAAECTLFTRQPRQYGEPLPLVTPALPHGSLVRPSVLQDGLIRVVTPTGLSGWTYARTLHGVASLWDIPAVEVAEPLAVADINGDGVRDLGLSTMDLIDGKGFTAVHPAVRKSSWLTGFFRRKWVELCRDTLWLRGVGADTGATAVPVARTAKKGVCRPGSCFYFVAMPGSSDSLAWVSAVRERGAIWTSAVPVSRTDLVGLYLVDSTLVLVEAKSISLVSAVDGSLGGQFAVPAYLRFGRGVFLNQSGFAVAKGDSVIFRDYSGSGTLGVAMGKSDYNCFPPFASSLESDRSGEGNFGQPLWPITSQAIPVITQVSRFDDKGQHVMRTVHLVSLSDGRELATISVSENYGDCRYDEHGIYVSGDSSFRAITWEGNPLAVPDLPFLSFPIWDGDRAVSYYSKPMALMLDAGTASRLADAVRTSSLRR